MTKVVDEQVQAFQQRRLPSQYAAIFLDANYLPLKRDTGQKEAVHCIQPTWLRTLTSISNATPTTKNNFQRKIHWIDSWFLSLTSTTRSPWSESIADSTDFRTPWNHPLFKLTTYYMYEGISFTQDSWRYRKNSRPINWRTTISIWCYLDLLFKNDASPFSSITAAILATAKRH